MAKLILIDHSLRSVGGHHYEYAIQFLREAQRAGYEIVMATHRQFRQSSAIPQSWQVLPLFYYDIYNKYAIPWGSNGKHPAWSELAAAANCMRLPACWYPAAWLASVPRLIRHLDRQRRLRRFVKACQELFRAVDLRPDDIVFVATMSAFDLVGLASFLQHVPQTAAATWHLQFHHDILEGREADYDRQSATVETVRRLFEGALMQIPNHRLVFHTTTAQLAAEYNRLQVGTFGELPYPVNPEFSAPERQVVAKRSSTTGQRLTSQHLAPSTISSHDSSEASVNSRPAACLHITCAGGMRREKGSHEIAEVIRQLWQPYFATGRARLCIQASRRRFRKLAREQEQLSPSGNVQPLMHIPHPLDMDDYVQFIHTSDIGLFLYDSGSYFTRASGILVELLAAGVPVIVPAGCWLAEQIAEPIYQYLDRADQEIRALGQLGTADIDWNRPGTANAMRFGGPSPDLRAQLDVPAHAANLLVRFRHGPETEAGRYVRIRFAQRDAQGELLDESVCVLGQRRQADETVGTLILLDADAARIELIFQDAYCCGAIEITDFQCSFLATRRAHESHLPSGAVGIIAADPAQIPRLLVEMIEHYDHYRRTAEQFSHQWMKRHSPRNTFATFMAREADALRRDQRIRAA